MAVVVLSYKGFQYPVEVIGHCVWLYHRFPLSLREVEEMMMERGVVVSSETIVRHDAPGNRVEVASGPGNDGTDRHCQTVRVRQARLEGEPVVEVS
jgi:hypothetical protein